MSGITVKSHKGMFPRIGPRLLNDDQAVLAKNCKLTSGRLVPLNRPLLVHTSLAASIGSVWRYRAPAGDNWLVNTKSLVNYARSPVAGDTQGRVYWTGDGEPRMSTYANAISGSGPYPAAWFVLGVVPPVTAPTINVTGGSSPVESRAYVYTFKTALGEESGPSPATFVSGNQSGTWAITGMDAAPPNSGTISAVANNTPAAGQVSVTFNSTFGLQALENVTFSGIVGMTDLNTTLPIVSISGTTVVFNLTTAQTYSSGGTWNRVAPHNTTGMIKCIYRTVGTNTNYQYVDQVAVATTSYNDTIAATALGNAIDCLYSRTPPKDGFSLISLANGCHAMLSGNQICLSEAYKPHSYPTRNRYTFSAIGIGLCASGSSAIILTDGYPHICSATTPEAASVDKLPGETLAPCMSRAGIVDYGQGCYYPSTDGLYDANPSGATRITNALYKKDEWNAIQPTTFVAAYSSGFYYAAHANSGAANTIWSLDMAELNGVIEYDELATVLYANPYDGNLYVAIGNKLYQWDADTVNRKTMYWTSKNFHLPLPINFPYAQVEASYGDIVPLNTTVQTANTALMATPENVKGGIADIELLRLELCESLIQTVPQMTQGFVNFILMIDGQPKFTKNCTANAVFKLPGGFKSQFQGWQIAANVGVDAEYVAQSMDEIQSA